jgi:lysophospholipase L1-like esterase
VTSVGVLAFGDSITNGGGELQWGVALQSWALWMARGLGLPYSGYAADGARIEDVLAHQIPLWQRASGDARYDLGCLYVGVNDVRTPGFDPAAFARGYATALDTISPRCDRVLTVTAPVDLGRPRADTTQLNAAIVRVAAERGALVLDLRDFGARNHVMTDHVHPTAFGQIAIAERALALLADDGLPTAVPPASLIAYETTPWKRLRGDLTYLYRHAKVTARSAAIRIPGRQPRAR